MCFIAQQHKNTRKTREEESSRRRSRCTHSSTIAVLGMAARARLGYLRVDPLRLES
jgi:hypothetical protein